jgi:hypothetical protein
MTQPNAILRRCVVTMTDTGIRLRYHDQPVYGVIERELPLDDPRDYVSAAELDRLLHGQSILFAPADQSYPRLARAFA